jgi:hypothetical protein
MIFEHDECRHHLGGTCHRHRRLTAEASGFAEAIDEQGRLALRRPRQNGRGSEALHRRDNGNRCGERKRAEVLEGRGRQHQREQVRKWTADE